MRSISGRLLPWSFVAAVLACRGETSSPILIELDSDQVVFAETDPSRDPPPPDVDLRIANLSRFPVQIQAPEIEGDVAEFVDILRVPSRLEPGEVAVITLQQRLMPPSLAPGDY